MSHTKKTPRAALAKATLILAVLKCLNDMLLKKRAGRIEGFSNTGIWITTVISLREIKQFKMCKKQLTSEFFVCITKTLNWPPREGVITILYKIARVFRDNDFHVVRLL